MKYYIGVEIGAKLTQVGLVDKFGTLLVRKKVQTRKERPLEEIVKDAANLINSLLADEDLDLKNIKHIGIGCPGAPYKDSENIMKNYVMGFYDAPIKEEFKKHFKLPIYIENDANCAALAESFSGAAEDLDYSVTINIGTGISCGIILENKIYDGFQYAGGLISHMVIDKNGPLCPCGRKGCLEMLCSETAIIKATKEAAIADPNSQIMKVCNNDLNLINELTAFEAAAAGDEAAKKVVEKYIDDLADGLANVANILMPEVIALCGSLASLGETLLKPVREKRQQRVFHREVCYPDLKLAEMGSAAVLIGAAILGIDRSK